MRYTNNELDRCIKNNDWVTINKILLQHRDDADQYQAILKKIDQNKYMSTLNEASFCLLIEALTQNASTLEGVANNLYYKYSQYYNDRQTGIDCEDPEENFTDIDPQSNFIAFEQYDESYFSGWDKGDIKDFVIEYEIAHNIRHAIEQAINNDLFQAANLLFDLANKDCYEQTQFNVKDLYNTIPTTSNLIYYMCLYKPELLDQLSVDAQKNETLCINCQNLLRDAILLHAVAYHDLETAAQLEYRLNQLPGQPTAIDCQAIRYDNGAYQSNDTDFVSPDYIPGASICWMAYMCIRDNQDLDIINQLMKQYVCDEHKDDEDAQWDLTHELINKALKYAKYKVEDPYLAASLIKAFDLELESLIPSSDNNLDTPFWLITAACYENNFEKADNDKLVWDRVNNSNYPEQLKFDVMRYAVENNENKWFDLLDELQRYGFDIQQQHPETGNTLLHITAAQSMVNATDYLIKSNPELRTCRNNSFKRADNMIGVETQSEENRLHYDKANRAIQDLLTPPAKRSLLGKRQREDDLPQPTESLPSTRRRLSKAGGPASGDFSFESTDDYVTDHSIDELTTPPRGTDRVCAVTPEINRQRHNYYNEYSLVMREESPVTQAHRSSSGTSPIFNNEIGEYNTLVRELLFASPASELESENSEEQHDSRNSHEGWSPIQFSWS